MSQRILIVGGGVIGLSIAYELACRGHAVSIIERGECGQQASWAGAGILVPANAETAIHPLEHLEAFSHHVHQRWSQALRKQTGIDNGFRKCGGLYLARTAGEAAALVGVMEEWRERGIEYEELDVESLTRRLGGFAQAMTGLRRSVWVPGEAQFSNPDHLKALFTACRSMGVAIHENVGEARLEVAHGRVQAVQTDERSIAGDNIFLTSGPWTQGLLEPHGVELPMQPVRGQIALYKIDPDRYHAVVMGPIINEGSRYLVPRRDGHLLAGSTIEEVGFDCETTRDGISELRMWAESLSSSLEASAFVKAWAGLRPGTYDGFPYLGKVNEFSNVFVATGHFKGGLHLSAGTAVLMADLVEQADTSIDLTPFSPSRVANHKSIENR